MQATEPVLQCMRAVLLRIETQTELILREGKEVKELLKIYRKEGMNC
jgi:hypothetical protein